MNRATPATGWARNPDGSLGWTLNPFTGCHNHDNGLCKGGGFPCYAYRLANGRLKSRYLANENIATVYAEGGEPYHKADKVIAGIDPFYPRFWPGRLAEMIWQQGTKPKGIFVCDMSDLFGIGIPEAWQHRIFSAIKCNPQHRFYLLTKQPQNLLRWSPFPDNCYVGVTATNGKMLWYAMKHLKAIQAKVKFLSLEPLLEAIPNDAAWPLLDSMGNCDISWIIIGAQTNPYKPPKIKWVQEIVEAADKAGVRVFLKDNLKPLLREYPEFWEDIPQGDHPNYESIAILRQEMPEEVKQCKES